MDLSQIVDRLDGVALLAVVVWLIYRQRNTDAASLLTSALERIATLEAKVAALQEHDRRHATVLQVHATWDARVTSVLTPEQSAALGPPPPLYPPEEA